MIALLLLVACGTGYEEGMLRRGELNCELADVCGNADVYGGLESCRDRAADQQYPACDDYDAGAMEDCIAAYERAIEDAACDSETADSLMDTCAVCGT